MRDPEILKQVKDSLALLSELYPGKAIEVRIPPYAATQCGDGPKHTRGTPPNVIEMTAETWLALVDGRAEWSEAYEEGLISASGVRANLSHLLPLRVQ